LSMVIKRKKEKKECLISFKNSPNKNSNTLTSHPTPYKFSKKKSIIPIFFKTNSNNNNIIMIILQKFT
jgi:Sec7-like guanine-nucleotide exchange factor